MSEVPAGSLVIRTASPGESDLVLPEGLVHLGWIDDRAVGTFVLRWSDKQVWGPDDSDGGYVHRLATHPDAAGQGLGYFQSPAWDAHGPTQGGPARRALPSTLGRCSRLKARPCAS